MTEQATRSGLLTFLALTALFTAPAWALIIISGDVGGGNSGYVRALMWGPGFAALATVALRKLDIGVLGFRWAGTNILCSAISCRSPMSPSLMRSSG